MTISTSALRLGGAALALAAAATGTLVTAPAHADDLAATSISIRTLHARVAPGASDTITGDLAVAGGTASGRTVSLEAHTPGVTGYSPVGTATTGTNGGLSLAVAPDVTTLYRWHYDGATDARSSSSGTVRVEVTETTHHAHRLATTLSVRATKPAAGVAVVRGRLRSGHTALPHRQVFLLAHRSGQSGWHFAKVDRTGVAGGVAFRVTPGSTTAYRLQYLGSQVFRPSHSGTVTVHVRQQVATSLSIRGRDTAHGGFAVSGVLRGGGHAVRGVLVTLWSHPRGTTDWTPLAHHRTGASGGVHFDRPGTPGLVYQLRFAGNTWYEASSSGIVVS